jgi:hypothetical protein
MDDIKSYNFLTCFSMFKKRFTFSGGFDVDLQNWRIIPAVTLMYHRRTYGVTVGLYWLCAGGGVSLDRDYSLPDEAPLGV